MTCESAGYAHVPTREDCTHAIKLHHMEIGFGYRFYAEPKDQARMQVSSSRPRGCYMDTHIGNFFLYAYFNTYTGVCSSSSSCGVSSARTRFPFCVRSCDGVTPPPPLPPATQR